MFSVLSVAIFVLVLENLVAGRAAAPRAVRERAHAKKKDLDVGAPLWVPRPILIVEKKVFGLGERHSEPRRRGTTPTSGERGEVSPEYVAPVSRPACRYGFTRFGTPIDGSTVQRACLENTRDQRRARPGRRNLCH